MASQKRARGRWRKRREQERAEGRLQAGSGFGQAKAARQPPVDRHLANFFNVHSRRGRGKA